jgi:hypothetical protein
MNRAGFEHHGVNCAYCPAIPGTNIVGNRFQCVQCQVCVRALSLEISNDLLKMP